MLCRACLSQSDAAHCAQLHAAPRNRVNPPTSPCPADQARGKLKRGGAVDTSAAARIVLQVSGGGQCCAALPLGAVAWSGAEAAMARLLHSHRIWCAPTLAPTRSL